MPWDELVVARILVKEGHHVRSLHERNGEGPRPDFEVCGVTTEVKTLDPGASVQTVKNALTRGRNQGEVLIVNAIDSGLSRRQADMGARLLRREGGVGAHRRSPAHRRRFRSVLQPAASCIRLAMRRPPERGAGL